MAKLTPIHQLKYKTKNSLFIKRDDLMPFSFGGNKVRIATQYFKDMANKQSDCVIAYGSRRSNMCRVIANMAKAKGIDCCIITPLEDDEEEYVENSNSIMVRAMGAKVITCPISNVAETIELVLAERKSSGQKPYYIYGDKYGQGNEKIAVQAYVEAYEEIKRYEAVNNITFEYIFHASGTGATQAGLICGQVTCRDCRKIIGISVARDTERGSNIIWHNIERYFEANTPPMAKEAICFVDKYIANGYGKYNRAIIDTIRQVLLVDGIPLDTTYTGKAFWGMTQYMVENALSNRNVLFIHTGGLPLFFDELRTLADG